MTDTLTWRVVRDEDGDPHTECPHCKALDSINECDVAIRWNRLNLAADGESATASLGDSGDWDAADEPWICTECLSRLLDAPSGFEITEWY